MVTNIQKRGSISFQTCWVVVLINSLINITQVSVVFRHISYNLFWLKYARILPEHNGVWWKGAVFFNGSVSWGAELWCPQCTHLFKHSNFGCWWSLQLVSGFLFCKSKLYLVGQVLCVVHFFFWWGLNVWVCIMF